MFTVAIEHPKRQLPKSKKTAGRRVKKAVKGRNTVQQSDDVDEGERSDDPNSTVEEEQAHEDPPQKRRCMCCTPDANPWY